MMQRKLKKRRLGFELLEPRNMLAGCVSNTAHLDITNDGFVSLTDLLVVINDLRRQTVGIPPQQSSDVNSDGVVSLLDALLEVNALRTHGNPFPVGTGTPPDANDDFVLAQEDEPTDITFADLFRNDTNMIVESVVGSLLDEPTMGNLVERSDGVLSYTPPQNYSGFDEFSYQVLSCGDTDIASVTIQIMNVNDAPVAQDDVFFVGKDTTLNVAADGVLINDIDTDGDEIYSMLISPPHNGTLNFRSDGSFDYTPNAGYVGGDAFTYRAGDESSLGPIAVVRISVETENSPPSAGDDYFFVNDGAIEVSAGGILANDTDFDGDELTSSLLGSVTNGNLSLFADGGFTYTSNPGFTGFDSFTYILSDGRGGTDTGTVTLEIPGAAQNNAPEAGDDYFFISGGTIDVPAEFGLLVNDQDPDDDLLTVSLVEDVAQGQLSLAPNGSFSYTAPSGFTGIVTFTYKVSDGNDGEDIGEVTLDIQ